MIYLKTVPEGWVSNLKWRYIPTSIVEITQPGWISKTLAAIQMNRIRKRFRIFAGTKLKDKNVKYNFFQTIKDGNPQSGLPISLIFKERNYAYFTEYFIHTPPQRFTV